MNQAGTGLGAVSRETCDRLATFVALLLQWNHTINLISRGDETRVWQRHIADSLALLPHLPAKFDRAIDLGSGGGFPGLVVAIATGVTIDLVEADQRKAAFLREAARVTEATVKVHAVRIEHASLAPAPLVMARALAPLAKLLEWAQPLLSIGGCCLFPKGRNVGAELTFAASQWHMKVETLDRPGGSTILRISEIIRVKHPN